MRYFITGLLFLCLACDASSVNHQDDLDRIAGSYFGILELGEKTKIEIHLQLKANGFYVITHQDLTNAEQLVRENGVFIYQDDEIQLARKQNGFRYFRFIEEKLFVYNLYHEPYTSFADSSFYLRAQKIELP